MTLDPRREFFELLGAERWQRLQAHFCQVLGVPLRLLSPDRHLLVEPDWPAWLDAQEVTERFRLGEELEELLPQGAVLKQTAVTSRPLGISFAAIPMRAASDKILAYLIVGPVVLGQRERLGTFQKRVESMGWDPGPIWSILLGIRLYSYSSFKSILAFLEEAGNTLLELAFQSRQIQSIVSEAAKVDHLVLRHYSQRLCHSLLEVASIATKAEGGSVMLFDERSRAYRIAAAHGLPEDVTHSVRICPGEGIAGWAAHREQVLLLDDSVSEPALKKRMTRKQLTSSLVAPLTKGSTRQPALGILSLRTTRTDSRFTREDANFIQKLTELAQTAFLNIAQKPTPQ